MGNAASFLLLLLVFLSGFGLARQVHPSRVPAAPLAGSKERPPAVVPPASPKSGTGATSDFHERGTELLRAFRAAGQTVNPCQAFQQGAAQGSEWHRQRMVERQNEGLDKLRTLEDCARDLGAAYPDSIPAREAAQAAADWTERRRNAWRAWESLGSFATRYRPEDLQSAGWVKDHLAIWKKEASEAEYNALIAEQMATTKLMTLQTVCTNPSIRSDLAAKFGR